MATRPASRRKSAFRDENPTPEDEGALRARMLKIDADLKALHDRADRLLADIARDRARFANRRARSPLV